MTLDEALKEVSALQEQVRAADLTIQGLAADRDSALASARSWEAKWLQEKMEHEKTKKELASREQAGVPEVQQGPRDRHVPARELLCAQAAPDALGGAVTSDHRPITEAELEEMERRAISAGIVQEWVHDGYGHINHARGSHVRVADVGDKARAAFIAKASVDMPRLITEVRRLRLALVSYAAPSNWTGGRREDVWDHPGPNYREAPGYQLARDALGWGPPDQPCDNPSCDGVKDDKTFGDAHRCFKDGRWLDDGSEM